MSDQAIITKTDPVQYQVEDPEKDEQVNSYYDALMQSIRDGTEDPDLLDEEDLLDALLEENSSYTSKNLPAQARAS